LRRGSNIALGEQTRAPAACAGWFLVIVLELNMAELASQPTSIQSMYNWYRDEKLFVNRKYQRKLVWTLEEKQRLIESILKKYPIPAILIAEKGDASGSYEIIDGLQRLHAIVSFKENRIFDARRSLF
jgi:hypothetical protein